MITPTDTMSATKHSPQVHLRLSTAALSGILSHAQKLRYVDRNAHSSKNLARYIRATVLVPMQDWVDARPDWMRQLDATRLNADIDETVRAARRRAGMGATHSRPSFPMWWDPQDTLDDPRQPRCFSPVVLPVDELAALAIRYGITNPRDHGFQFRPAAAAGNFLEAWGRGAIYPTITPDPWNKRHNIRNAYEMAW